MFDKMKKSMDDIKDKLTDAVDEHGPKIAEGVDKAATVVDQKTGGKYHDHIDKASGAVKGAVGKLDSGKPGSTPTDPTDPTTPTTPADPS
jgi:uncharacterized protein YjbJ (UPF0337 family)